MGGSGLTSTNRARTRAQPRPGADDPAPTRFSRTASTSQPGPRGSPYGPPTRQSPHSYQPFDTSHLAFLARRRALRPGEEYRAPSDEEWQQFLGHFERRKVSTGTCARAFSTPCIHEHTCFSELNDQGGFCDCRCPDVCSTARSSSWML